jgi:hypothetical protein
MLSEILKKTANKIMVFRNIALQSFCRYGGTMISPASGAWESAASRTLGLWVPMMLLYLATSPAWAGELIQIAPLGNPNVPLQINAYGGAKHGTTLKVVFGCPPGSTDCTWTLLPNGMIVSDTNPTLAWNAYGGDKHGADITLVNNCTPDLNGCTWTVRSDGLIVSKRNPQFAVNAFGGAFDGAPLKLVNNCAPHLDGCKWVTSQTGGASLGPPRMLYSAEMNNALAVNAYGGAKDRTELQIVNNCRVDIWDCTWRLQSDGMIISDSSANLAWNAYGGAQVGTKVTLVVGCPADNPDCQWDLRPDGLIVSRRNPNLAVKAQGGPRHNAPLMLVNDCTPAIAGCKWSTVPSSRVNPANALLDQFLNRYRHGEVIGPVIDPVPNPPSTILKRPFNIVAVGDSLMWGQGLSHQNKFVTQVAESLKKQLGKQDVVLHLEGLAHSGAITYPKVGEEALDGPGFPGEVPKDYPSIHYQITKLVQTKVQPADVDLVLIDGCINNVTVNTIITPLTKQFVLRDDTKAFCGPGMQNILTEVAGIFPQAKVIVVGYYAIVSAGEVGGTDPHELVEWLGKNGIILPPLIGDLAMKEVRDRIAVLSTAFAQESENALRLAVEQVNALPLGRYRFRYAAPKFEVDNAFAGSYSWLWRIPTSSFDLIRGSIESHDEVFSSRAEACEAAKRVTGSNLDLKCIIASTGHPNRLGAMAYANVITSATSFFLDEWLARFGLSRPGPEREKNIKDDPPENCQKAEVKCSPR